MGRASNSPVASGLTRASVRALWRNPVISSSASPAAGSTAPSPRPAAATSTTNVAVMTTVTVETPTLSARRMNWRSRM